VDLANIAVRLGQYATLAPLFGLAAFAFYARAASVQLGWRLGLIWLASLGLAASLASILVLAAQMSGGAAGAADPSVLWAVISGTDAGKAWFVRLLAVAVTIYAARASRPLVLVRASGVSLASLAWSGHAAAEEGLFGAIRLVGDIMHLLAAGIWVGALAAFVGLVLRKGAAGVTAAALSTFSGVGSAVVAILIATGLINTWHSVEWRPWPVLTTSLWGQLLLAKLALLGGMLALAAANRFLLTPRLQARSAGAEPDQGHLRLSLIVELSLGIAVLVMVSVLGTLAPPASN
jgi:putative copper resistance protein D